MTRVSRRARWVLFVLAILGSIGINIQPASADAVKNTGWHMGQLMVQNDGVTRACSAGAYFRVTTNNVGIAPGYYMMTAKHCVETPHLMRKYHVNPASNYFGEQDILYGPGSIDIAMIRMGPISDPRRSLFTNVTNYCNNPAFGFGNCSSYHQAPFSTNTTFTTKYRAGTGGINNGAYLCKSGYRTGVSCGTAVYDFNHPAGIYQRWQLTNLTGCGMSHGDSGSVVFQVDSNGNPWIVGIVSTLVGAWQYAEPGSGCIPTGDPYTPALGFYPTSTMLQNLWGLTLGVNVFVN